MALRWPLSHCRTQARRWDRRVSQSRTPWGRTFAVENRDRWARLAGRALARGR